MQEWYTYIVKCSDNSLYTGITTDLERRVNEHNSSNKGAKYTKTRRPVKLVYNETHTDRSSSCKRESEIKKLSRTDKLKIINEYMLMVIHERRIHTLINE
jgi:putative endonuclease